MNNNQDKFHNQIVLITGGSVGIGAALAHLLAQNGAHVWILARREEYLRKTLNGLVNSSIHPEQKHGYVICNVSDEAQVDSVIDQVFREIGIPDILINCAGVVHPAEFLSFELDKFHWMMDINFFGTVYITRKVLPAMIARGSGYIVNVSSLAAILGIYGYTAYAASKSAVLAFTEALRLEYKSKNISFSVVLPSDTDTPQLEYELNYRPEEIRGLLNLGTIHSPESVARKIINGMVRRKFLILPGSDALFTYWAVKLLGYNFFPIIDWFIRRARRK